MALKIRLRQQGRNNYRSFRIVVADIRSPRDGKYLEGLGWYDPHLETGKDVMVKEDRLAHWLSQGAQVSENVKALIKRAAPSVLEKKGK
ncbi:MAG: 30S ribosomal protein S16 [Parachlamydiales bacterium]|nr:30S ribosomal protein S16 [Parachlamydiales bacterium]